MSKDQVVKQEYAFDLQTAEDDGFKRYLQGILNDYHKKVHPLMEVPRSQRFVIRVNDPAGTLVGGALFWVYWGWVDVTVLALEEAVRGKGLGRQLMARIEEKARQENCCRIRVETFETEVGFYQRLGYRVVGELEDYPEGYDYYWMRKDL